jgi:predicted site-specific integrase-resolvase
MPEMISQKEAAFMLGISWETLRQYRRAGIGPSWFRVANSVVRYRRSDVEAYLESRRVVTAA